MILAEDASKVAAREENGARSIVALDTRFFAEVRRDHIDLDGLCSYQARARFLIAIHTAEPGAEVTIP